jgi:hypothetical protein
MRSVRVTRNDTTHVPRDMFWQHGFSARVYQLGLCCNTRSVDDLITVKEQVKVIDVSTSLSECGAIIQEIAHFDQ